MAKHPLLFIFCAIFVALFPLTFSRSLSETTHTLLDVSAALQQAHAVLSFDPETLKPMDQQQLEQIFANSSSFSLQLHSRDSLYRTSHKDYKSLVFSRLERESARVDSLATKLQLALSGVKRSDLRPMETELQPRTSPLR
ncbi:hypothetical protein SLA2020_434010 [Shorea laevis]